MEIYQRGTMKEINYRIGVKEVLAEGDSDELSFTVCCGPSHHFLLIMLLNRKMFWKMSWKDSPIERT